ncbi:sulfotransferase family protein [Marinoscillum furvescens]|uniref:Sulfotransferase family protein n=1 Tax=Marinoscillum furvescens DSM 4134 TaxID=1122208 RepID=A0A3D9L1A6_MARFU|nr:sulfotransferase [Marinoscillum furvescens]RED95655.1 sulfotransferase family protein [Marinoscillum furvescens DSM 4134]
MQATKAKDNQLYTQKSHEWMPDFLVIGAGKCGTTSLDNYLKQHPEIYISPVKEPNFFGYEMLSEADLAARPGEQWHYRQSVTNLEDYQTLFDGATSEQVSGETSNTYLYHQMAPERIRYHNPNMKLIAIFRQPAERLWSRYMHLARENRLPTRHFSDCLDQSSIWWKRNDLIREGFYYKNLSRYYQLFGADQIKVYLFDEFKANGPEVLKDIYAFLGVDTDFQVDKLVALNQSGIVKNKSLDGLIGNHGLLPKLSKRVFGKYYQELKESPQLQSLLVKLRKRNLEKPAMDPEIKQILTRDIYGEDIQNLQKLTGKNLSHWW